MTGQQVGLFLGPAYSLYKAATAVALARRISKTSRLPTVPVFWLQSEDHDAEEVADCGILDGQRRLAHVTVEPAGEERASMAERVLGGDVKAALAALVQHLSGSIHVDETERFLARHYRPEAGWVEAFGKAIAEVFAADGLLVLDPRTPVVAKLASPVHRQAFAEAEQIDAALVEGASLLEQAGEDVGVAPRKGCSLSFYHPHGRSGSRFRLNRAADGWKAPQSERCLSTAELGAQTGTHPLKFSTSSMLRVVLQNTLLPTLAQVAGPGEARYLRQTPPLLEHFGVAEPLVVPRAQIAVTDAACRRHLTALDLSLGDVGDRGQMLQRLAKEDAGPSGDQVASQLSGALERELERLQPTLRAVDPSLERSIQRTRRHVERGVSKFAARIDRARAQRDRARVARVERVCDWLRPGGVPQERAVGFAYLSAKVGAESLIKGVFEAVETHLDLWEQGASPELQEVAL